MPGFSGLHLPPYHSAKLQMPVPTGKNDSDKFHDHHRLGYQLSNGIVVMLVVLTILIICSNLLVISAAIYDRCLRKLRYAPLVSLCVADFFMGLIPGIILIPAAFTTFHQGLVTAAFTVSVFIHMASILNLVAVCIERWIAIFKPLRYGAFLKNRNIFAVITTAWTTAAVMSLPTLAFRNFQIYDKPTSGLKFERIYLLVLCGAFFLVSLVVGFMQFQIIRLVKRHINKVGPKFETSVSTTEVSTSSAGPSSVFNNMGAIPKRDIKRREIASAVAINLTYLAVVFTWTPCVIMVIQTVLHGCADTCEKGMQFSLFFIYLNCLINPIIYAIRIKDFRMAILKLLSVVPCCKRCVPSRDTATNTDTVVSVVQRRSIISSPESNNLPLAIVSENTGV